MAQIDWLVITVPNPAQPRPCREQIEAGQVCRHLAAHPPDLLGRFFNFDIDPRGSSATVP